MADLKVESMNIAIPTSMIVQDDEGQLKFTFYVQLSEGFLSKEQLQLALLVSRFFVIIPVDVCSLLFVAR